VKIFQNFIELERKFIKNNNDALKAETIPLQTSNIALHKKVEEIVEQQEENEKRVKILERELD
jgi:hypothetical protein